MYLVINKCLTLNLVTTTIVAPTSNASKWQMGFNSAFKGLKAVKVSNFSGHYLRNRSTLDIGVLGYIGTL